MDELVTLEEADGGSDILLVVPKATVLQVRQKQPGCRWEREGLGGLLLLFLLTPSLSSASTEDLPDGM